MKNNFFTTSGARQSEVVKQHMSSKTKGNLLLYIVYGYLCPLNDKYTMLIHCVNIFTFRHHRSSLTTIETILKPFVLNYLFKPNNQKEVFRELIFKPTIIRFYQYFLAIRLMASLISEAKAKNVNAIVIVCVTESFWTKKCLML